MERLPKEAGGGGSDRRAPSPEIGTAQMSQIHTSQNAKDSSRDRFEEQAQLKQQRPTVDTSSTTPKEEDDDDDEIEIMSDRIRSIIDDPDSSFTYDNISANDMVSLEEMMSQSSQIGTMKLVDSDGAEAAEAAAANKEDGSASATATASGDGENTTTKPAELVDDAAGRPGASQAADAESAAKVL